MENCKTCANAIFDETFGQYKCKVMKIYLYGLVTKEDCPSYKKGTPQDSQQEYEPM